MKKVLTLMVIFALGVLHLSAQNNLPTAVAQKEIKSKAKIGDVVGKIRQTSPLSTLESKKGSKTQGVIGEVQGKIRQTSPLSTLEAMAPSKVAGEKGEVYEMVLYASNLSELDAAPSDDAKDTPFKESGEDVKIKFPTAQKLVVQDFTVYPTAATNIVNVEAQLDGLVKMFVVSMTGEVKTRVRFEGSYTLDVSNYAKGTYVIRIGRGSDYVTYKFMKQ